jgi:hypothetical protein
MWLPLRVMMGIEENKSHSDFYLDAGFWPLATGNLIQLT